MNVKNSMELVLLQDQLPICLLRASGNHPYVAMIHSVEEQPLYVNGEISRSVFMGNTSVPIYKLSISYQQQLENDRILHSSSTNRMMVPIKNPMGISATYEIRIATDKLKEQLNRYIVNAKTLYRLALANPYFAEDMLKAANAKIRGGLNE